MGVAHDSADDVGDLHEVVIDDVGEVVRRVAVGLDDDEVALVLVLLVLAVDDVGEGRPALAAEPDDVALAGPGAARRLVGRDAAACAGVADEVAAVQGLLLVPLEVLGLAEAAVCLATLDQLVGVVGVVVKPLGLSRGSDKRGKKRLGISPECMARRDRPRRDLHPSPTQPISDH